MRGDSTLTVMSIRYRDTMPSPNRLTTIFRPARIMAFSLRMIAECSFALRFCVPDLDALAQYFLRASPLNGLSAKVTETRTQM